MNTAGATETEGDQRTPGEEILKTKYGSSTAGGRLDRCGSTRQQDGEKWFVAYVPLGEKA